MEYESSNYFLNFSLIIKTSLSPWALLLEIKKIELLLGRQKKTNHLYEDRFIDIDIILYEKNVIHENFLKIPHPKAHLRAFVMMPSLEIAENWIHPLFKLSLRELYQNYQNFLKLQKIHLYGKILP